MRRYEQLQIEYVQEHELFMKIYADNGFRRDELSKLQVQMLQHYVIPGLLPMRVEENDGMSAVCCCMTGKQLAYYASKTNHWKREEFCRFFIAVLDTAMNCSAYMLQEDNIILRKETVFVGEDVGEVFLSYIPLHTENGMKPFRQSLLDFTEEMGFADTFANQQAWLKLCSTVKDSGLSLAGIRDWFAQEEWHQLEHQVERSAGHQAGGKLLDARSEEHDMPDFNQSVAGFPYWEDSGTALPRYKRILVGVPLSAVLTLIWSRESVLLISSGLALLFITAYLYFRYVQGYSEPKLAEEPIIQVGSSQQEIGLNGLLPQSSVLDETCWLTPSLDATVMLNTNETYQKVEPVYKFLIVTEGKRHEVVWEGERFLIGRDESIVQYVDQTTGVSKLHLEFTNHNGSLTVKDLASKNGSLYNEAPMIPYKEYPLTEKDEVIMIRTRIKICKVS